MENLSTLTTKQLQHICRSKDLPVYYKLKVDLVKRIKNFRTKEKKTNETEGNVETVINISGMFSDNIDDDNKSDDNNSNGNNSDDSLTDEEEEEMSEPVFTFKDVEDSLESFSGEDNRDVKAWFKNFEEIAAVCKWCDVKKYLYARRLLKNAAKAAVESKDKCTAWAQLKDYLLELFGNEVNSIDIHKKLNETKKLNTETFLEYFFKMKNIANLGKVDDKSWLEYVVAGIPDTPQNKAILYTAATPENLMILYKSYEKVKAESVVSDKQESQPKKKFYQAKLRCVNCGSFNHLNDKCPDKTKGPRCFNCNEFGHFSRECPKKLMQQNPQVNVISEMDMHIGIFFENVKQTALIDTGSDVTLIKRTIFDKMNLNLSVTGKPIILTGLSRKSVRSFGSVFVTLTIGNKNYVANVHVISDDILKENILIGKDVLVKLDLRICNGKIVFGDSAEHKSEESEVLNIETDMENDKKDYVSHIKRDNVRASVLSVVSNYKPIIPKIFLH